MLVEPAGRRRGFPGGSPANVALGMGRLGHPVPFATRIGLDHFGGLLCERPRPGLELAPGSVYGPATSTATAPPDALRAATYTFELDWNPAREAVEAVCGGPPARPRTGSIAAVLPPGADPPTRAELSR